MKKRLLIVLLVLALSAVMGLNMVSAQGGTELKAVALATASVYADPSAAGEPVGEVAAYSEVTVVSVDASGAWLETPDGYVMADAFAVLNLPLLAPKVMVATNSAGSTALYAEPSFASEFIGGLADGKVASVLGADGEWAYIVTDDGQKGWSIASAWDAFPAEGYMAFVTLGNNPELGIFAEAQIGSDLVTTLPDGAAAYVLAAVDDQWVEVMTLDGQMGYAIVDNFATLPNTYVEPDVNQAQAALYAEPNQAAEILGVAPAGAVLTYVGAVDDYWVELYHPLFGTGYGLALNFGNVYTTAVNPTEGAVVRAGPNDNLYNAIATLPAGTEVIVKGVSESGSWIEVAIPYGEVEFGWYGVSGWMRDYLFVDALGTSYVDASMLAVTE